ncbi:hypothetical protein N1E90_15160 [Pseudomonas aeruginosa]|nr:hypothetical protein [Pseudomonas aeruginosa]MCS9184751.1 hypothetical protein [Pseudomonas aeruginosa]MCS9194229.1 hypothetical protein [Pseudomonas aeruginosa]
MLNGGPLNSDALNSAAQSVVPGPEPIIPGYAFTWRAIVRVGDDDVTPLLTGEIEVDREEGAAGVASFSIYLGDGPVVPTDWIGRTVTIDYATETAGELSQGRRFTGRVTQPAWNPVRRVLDVSCTDQLQQRVEAMEIAAVDALVGGAWSADVFEPVDGRSRWDYAQERLTSVTGSLDCSPYGALRVTSWLSVAPAYEFGQGSTVYGSLAVELADLSSQTNRVEIECDYRFSRLWQLNASYGWQHPGTGNAVGEAGFCNWRGDDTELPDVEMITSATESSGQTLFYATWYPLPPTGVYCNPPAAWVNSFTDLLLGGNWIAGRRWTQAVTERYRLVMEVQPSVTATGPIVGRQRASFEIESDKASGWESDPITGGSTGHSDEKDDNRRLSALNCLLAQGATTLIAAHRGTTVTWDVSTSMILPIDLVHTLRLDDQGARAVGKCRRIVDRLDLASGSALTTISIAVMRGGGGAADPLVPPAGSSDPVSPPSGGGQLSTQLGGRNGSPPYDDDADGFSGNWSNRDPGAELFPRRFSLTANDIPETYRDEHAPEIAATYRVSVTDDVLEM